MFRTGLCIALLLLCRPSFADANDGEFLGFKIGNPVPIEDTSKLGGISSGFTVLAMSVWQVPAPNGNFDAIRVEITPITRTALEIWGFIKTASTTERDMVYETYLRIFREKYSDWSFKQIILGAPNLECEEIQIDRGPKCDIVSPDERYWLQLYGGQSSFIYKHGDFRSGEMDVWVRLLPWAGGPLDEELDEIRDREATEFEEKLRNQAADSIDKSDL